MTTLAIATRRSDLWSAALAAFLLRGGIALVALPILVLPSTVGVATFFGPTSVTPAGPSPSLVAFAVAAGAGLLAWGLLGGLAAAAAEAALVRRALDIDAGPASLRTCARIVLARAVASLPIVLALGWAGPRLVAAAYAQLTHPADPSVAFAVRVVGDAPDALVALAAGWLVANALGAVATRRIVLCGDGAFGAVGRAVRRLVGDPLGSLAAALAGTALVGVVLGPALAASRTLWGEAALALDAGSTPAAALLVAGFVVAWSGALVGAGILGSWHGSGWTRLALDRPAAGRPVGGPPPATLGPTRGRPPRNTADDASPTRPTARES